MKQSNPAPRIGQTARLFSLKTISAAAIVAVMLCLAILSLPVRAQSGRKSPPTPKPSPGQSNTAATTSAQEEQTASNGKIAGEGETVEGDTLTINTGLVTVPVKVMDHGGKNVLNLQRKDFRVFENGVEQRIAYFATVDQPFTVVLLLDTSGSTEFKIEDIQSAAISFVNQLKEQDRVMVMSFDDRIQTFCEPTSDRATLIQAIRQTKTGDSTRLYDAVEQVIQQKLRSIPGRKAVVLFTDGVDTASGHATYKSTLKLVQESDAGVYVVAYDTSGDLFGGGASTKTVNGGRIPMPGGSGNPNPNGGRFPNPNGGGGYPNPSGGGYPNPSGGGNPNPSGGGSNPSGGGYPGPNGGGFPNPNGPMGDYRVANEYLHEITFESGGEYYRGDTIIGLSGAFRELADELRRQYSIGYYPPAGQSGQRRDIKVRVNQPGLVVKARDNYIYSQSAAKDNKK
ncbi:MAG TPA: hypothetical protein DC054_21230 [Blastocatellia bacterium]|nr:hypothetical protein [Blastocatellia bacterium]